MLALAQYEAGLCPKCGRPLSVCTAPENQGKFTVGLPTRCHAETALLVARDGMQGYPNPGALMLAASLED